MPTTASRITKVANICGGDACIEGHRIPVWVLAGYQRSGKSDADILSFYPQLSEADLAAAWEYAATHRKEIDQAIDENEAGAEGLVEQQRMLLYADEDFPHPAVDELRNLGHDVLTAQDDGRQQTPDPILLARAEALGRVVLTGNRRHYERLHRQGAKHCGIVSTTRDNDFPALASRIHAAIAGLIPGRWCIRVNRPAQL